MTIQFFTHADNDPSALPTSPGWHFTDAELDFIRDNWETMTAQEVADALGRSRPSIHTIASKKLGLKKSAAAKFMANSKGQATRPDAYSDAEKQYLRENWQTMTAREMAAALGRTKGSVKSMGQKTMGLKKSHAAFQQIMKRKGPNAGTFKKGNLPTNTIYGDEQVIKLRRNRDRKPYYWIRVGFRQWRMYHLHIWEAAHGPVPPGYFVVFSNRDTTDVRLENLELLTRKAHAIRNSGSLNLADGYVATTLAWRDPEGQKELLTNYPELIDLKRTQLQLNRTIKHQQHDNAKPAKTRRTPEGNGR